MKIRVTRNDNEENIYTMLINVISEKFEVINISRSYENRNGNEKRTYIDIIQK